MFLVSGRWTWHHAPQRKAVIGQKPEDQKIRGDQARPAGRRKLWTQRGKLRLLLDVLADIVIHHEPGSRDRDECQHDKQYLAHSASLP